jgi:hypothetical protein
MTQRGKRRSSIVNVSQDGLSVLIEGNRHFLNWDAVGSVTGGVSKRDDNQVFIAFTIDGTCDERILLITENDPAWDDLVEALHIGLPIAPLQAWAAGIAAFPGVYTLYERSPR